eukprot:Skav233529  [mRNA]  locus=scaffold2975:341764:342255:+ [translate_table: standard]
MGKAKGVKKDQSIQKKFPEKNTVSEVGIFNTAFEASRRIDALTNLDLNTFWASTSEEELNQMLQFVRHNQTNLKYKMEMLAEYQTAVKTMMRVRDYLSEVILKYKDLTHDAILTTIKNSDQPEKTDSLANLITIEQGKREERARIIAEFQQNQRANGDVGMGG